MTIRLSTEPKPEAGPERRKRMPAAERRALIAAAATDLFAEHGYRGTSVEEISRRAGVTPPVVYDHFESKQALYRELLERHFADLREVWRENFFVGKGAMAERIGDSFDAWFAYVEAHPFAGRTLFRDGSGDPEVARIHAEVAAASRAEVMPLAATAEGVLALSGAAPAQTLDMLWIALRGVLQGLAVWWVDHPEVPREQVVAAAMNSLWVGLERTQAGEGWSPPGS